MQQTYEFYVVDPGTWKDVKPVENVKSCAISWDMEAETLGSATIDLSEVTEECYIRIYLVTVQNGVKEKHPLGTFLFQTPSVSFNGKTKSDTMDGYTPLIELKEKLLPLGYFIPKYTDLNEIAYLLANENARAPVVPSRYSRTWRVDKSNTDVYGPSNDKLPASKWINDTGLLSKGKHIGDLMYDISKSEIKLYRYVLNANTSSYSWDSISDGKINEGTETPRLNTDFVADPEDTVLTFLTDLLTNDKKKFGLDELGRILFVQDQELESLRPIWTYDDGNSSILYPDITLERDLYGIPNVVEVVCAAGSNIYEVRVVNDDPNSPVSTVNRGREIIYRTTDPGFTGIPSKTQVTEYAEQLLKELSTLEYSITYTHAYCPVKIGDCVRLNYKRAGLTNIKAKVVSQSIDCSPGCPVTEKAVFTSRLWR